MVILRLDNGMRNSPVRRPMRAFAAKWKSAMSSALTRIFALFALCLALAACQSPPLFTDKLLEGRAAAIDERLVGTWGVNNSEVQFVNEGARLTLARVKLGPGLHCCITLHQGGRDFLLVEDANQHGEQPPLVGRRLFLVYAYRVDRQRLELSTVGTPRMRALSEAGAFPAPTARIPNRRARSPAQASETDPAPAQSTAPAPETYSPVYDITLRELAAAPKAMAAFDAAEPIVFTRKP
jgi:hypothetical protein